MQNFINFFRVISFRTLSLIGVMACILLIAVAFYMQYVQGLEPCPLCMMQRIVIYSIGTVFLVGAAINPTSGRRIFASLSILLGAAGVALASRQLWLQNLPKDQVPACGPGLDYMMEVLPWNEVLSVMIRGTGDCAEVQWTFLGLSIPGWTLVAFLGFIALALMQWIRKPI